MINLFGSKYSVPVNPVSLNLLSFWPARGRTGPAAANNFVSTDDSNDYSDNGIAKRASIIDIAFLPATRPRWPRIDALWAETRKVIQISTGNHRA